MFRNRTFLAGLGIGLIVGALLLQMMIVGERSQQRLDEFGSQMHEGTSYTQEQVDAMLAAEREKVRAEQPTKTPVQASPSESHTDAKHAAPDSEINPVLIYIRPSTGVTDVANVLMKQGIIHDKDAFVQQMVKSKKLVRTGYFLFQGKPDLQKVISIISSTPIVIEKAGN